MQRYQTIKRGIAYLYSKHGGLFSGNRIIAGVGDFYRSNESPNIVAQQMAKSIAKHLDLYAGRVDVKFTATIDVPGRLLICKPGEFNIELHERHRENIHEIAAIIAHEMTHIFLHNKGIVLADVFENEILTDTAAIMLGLGILIVNGFSVFTEYRGNYVVTRTQTFGYLLPEQYGYLLARIEIQRGNEGIYSFLKNRLAKENYIVGKCRYWREQKINPLSGTCASISFCRLYYRWRRYYETSKWLPEALKYRGEIYKRTYTFSTDNTVIIECPKCCQAIRLPLRKGNILTTCPVCGRRARCFT